MSRIAPLPIEQWDAELRQMTRADGATPLERLQTGITAHSPELAKALMVFAGTIKRHTSLPRRLVELVRLRIAFHNQCRSCMAVRYQSGVEAGVTEELVCSLEQPMEAPDLTEAEKAAIAYSDLSSTNHFAITDESFADLRKHFSEKEIVELCMVIAYFIGFGRMGAALDMIEELPSSFQDKSSAFAPWLSREAVLVQDSSGL